MEYKEFKDGEIRELVKAILDVIDKDRYFNNYWYDKENEIVKLITNKLA